MIWDKYERSFEIMKENLFLIRILFIISELQMIKNLSLCQ